MNFMVPTIVDLNTVIDSLSFVEKLKVLSQENWGMQPRVNLV